MQKIKFENLVIKNMVLDKLKESEHFRKVSQDLSWKERGECKKLLQEKVNEVNKKGGNSKWVVRITGTTWGLP